MLSSCEDLTEDLVIAYEPVWAIGSGEAASADVASEMHLEIKAVLADRILNSAFFMAVASNPITVPHLPWRRGLMDSWWVGHRCPLSPLEYMCIGQRS